MREKMIALQYMAPGKVDFIEVDIPQPEPDEVLVKVLGIATCNHWDLHMMHGEPMFKGSTLDYPARIGAPGHEAVGEIAALGPGVQGWVVGTRVISWGSGGHSVPYGAYAQYNTWAADSFFAMPSNMDIAAAAPLELAMSVQVAFNRLTEWDLVAGRRFAVSGLGPAGLIALQMAKAYGASQVVGIDPDTTRHALARQLGADETMVPDASQFPPDRYAPTSFGSAIDCTPNIPRSIEFLLDHTREAVALMGVLRDDVRYNGRHWAGLSLIGYGSRGPSGGRNRETGAKAWQLVMEGKLNMAPILTQRLPLSEYRKGIALIEDRQAIKVLFVP
ncbi:MAG: alcohol dehydrogenase catalytic domain-containing protein [Chloroflexi bacterium]|nr:alcohol dehydrogenase catalytic domain-containing protein [Chloroflexota bacterium]